MAKRFNSVAEMMGELGETASQNKEMVADIKNSQISSILFVLRNKAKLTQEDVALKAEWTQSKVSKMEHQYDHEFSIGDIAQYCRVVGFNLEIGFSLKSTTFVDKVKHHFFKMKHYLDKISDSAQGDAAIQKGVNGVMMEASNNLLILTQACIGKIKNPQQPNASVIVSKPLMQEQLIEEGKHEIVAA